MRFKLALAITASFAAAPVMAAEQTEARGLYVGAFGGVGSGGSTDITQRGTMYFVEATGGPLVVNAAGRAGSEDVSFFGGQVGYELQSASGVLPAFELEGLRVDTGTRRATLDNSNVRLYEQSFDNSFSTDATVFLANLVVSFPTSFHGLTPYVGGGIGAANVDADNATSVQTDPVEVGINHFNSGDSSSAWTFAAQAKAGARFSVTQNLYVFGEYRYLYLGSTDQDFGPTDYPTHVPTSAWNVGLDATKLHLASVGIGFNF